MPTIDEAIERACAAYAAHVGETIFEDGMRAALSAFLADVPVSEGMVEVGDDVTYKFVEDRARLGILEGERRGMEKAAGASFQARVDPWFRGCFPPAVCNDRLERGDRATEEVLELMQAVCANLGVDFAPRAHALVDYVAGRPVGEIEQEVGGVMVTVAALCLAHSIDMHDCGETELARITQPEIVEKIRAKQAAKPTGSALPIAQAAIKELSHD